MTPSAILVLIIGIVFIVVLYWFKLRALKRRLALTVLGLIITAYPTLTFFVFLRVLTEFYFKRKGDVRWVVSPSQDFIGLMGGWTSRTVSLSSLIMFAILTPVFFICLALLIKEWKSRRDEQAREPSKNAVEKN